MIVRPKGPIDQLILNALIFYKRKDLFVLLKNAEYELDESTSYGRAYNSYRTGVDIYSDIVTNEKLKELNESDNDSILKAFHVVYPVKSESMDLCWIEYFIDSDLPIPTESNIEVTVSYGGIEFINEQIQKCDTKLVEEDFEGALTNSKTLIETIIKYVLDGKQIVYKDSEDIMQLYKKVANELKMNPADYSQDSFKKILSGFFGIIQGVSEIRNVLSDAHGKSENKRYRIERRHAKLVVDAAKTISEFVYNAYMDKEEGKDITSR